MANATNLEEVGDTVLASVASNGFFIAAGVAVAASIALRFFGMRQIMKFGPPRVMPLATTLSTVAPILLCIGLARKIDSLGGRGFERG